MLEVGEIKRRGVYVMPGQQYGILRIQEIRINVPKAMSLAALKSSPQAYVLSLALTENVLTPASPHDYALMAFSCIWIGVCREDGARIHAHSCTCI